jgi:hypothetical protein
VADDYCPISFFSLMMIAHSGDKARHLDKAFERTHPPHAPPSFGQILARGWLETTVAEGIAYETILRREQSLSKRAPVSIPKPSVFHLSSTTC